jgi:hypothetical protein
MANHAGDVYRTGSTAFSGTETNLSSIFIAGAPRGGVKLVATHQGVTGGTNDVSTVHQTGNYTAGAFTLTLGGRTTAAIPFNASPAQIALALLALKNCIINNIPYLGALPIGSISATGPATGLAAGDVVVTFANELGAQPITLTGSVGTMTGGAGFAIVHTTTGVGPTCAITVQHNDDNSSTWDAYRRFGTLDVPVYGRYRPTMILDTPRKYISLTLTFGGSGTYKNLQVFVTPSMEGYN